MEIYQLKFKLKEFILEQKEGHLEKHIFIVLVNERYNHMHVLPISKYFIIKMRNKAYNTRLSYAKILVSLLNYVMIQKSFKYRITKIEEITAEHISDYLNDLAQGNIGNKIKTKMSIEKTEQKLRKMYREILGKEDNDDLFLIKYTDKIPVKRVKNISKKFLWQLFYTCDLYYPNLKLALALQAFAGLRKSEVCNVSIDKIEIMYTLNRFEYFLIDLREEIKLRDDCKSCGSIKKKRKQFVYPIFLDELQKIYEEHIKKYNKNKYGALFLNNNGQAIMTGNYGKKFERIIEKTLERLSGTCDLELLGEINNIMDGRCGTHVLRHFYTKSITATNMINSAAELASWRGDSNLNSAITYLVDSYDINDKLNQIQGKVYEEFYGDE